MTMAHSEPGIRSQEGLGPFLYAIRLVSVNLLPERTASFDGKEDMGIRVALAGNPNCGKTTLFNNLTGANQYVGNWPGVTVERKEGTYTRDREVRIVDLPGHLLALAVLS